jgi:ADP-ribose pyrophosphatase YjhB (NUDIX family)
MSHWRGEGHPGWLEAEQVETITSLTPILCVDILPVRDNNGDFEAGLIARTDYEGGETYAMVGGRVLRTETLDEAVTRQIRETLGDSVTWEGNFNDKMPDSLLQYFPEQREGEFGRDPTKHSVALTWLVEINGEVETGGEATEFRWFNVEKLPPKSLIGFGHWIMIEKLLHRKLEE